MEKFKNFKHRLSVSVDKLSPSRKGRPSTSSHRNVASTEDNSKSSHEIATFDPNISTASSPGVPLRHKRKRGVRPHSLEESDIEDVNSANTSYMDTSMDVTDPPILFIAERSIDCKPTTCTVPTTISPPIESSVTPTSKLNSGTESLVMEVMKEVEKIEMITGDMKQKNTSLTSGNSEIRKIEDKLEFIDDSDDAPLNAELDKSSSSIQNSERSILNLSKTSESLLLSANSEKQLSKTLSEPTSSISSTLHAESLTSGYFSDSTSESSASSKPKAAATVFSTLSNIEDKPPPKKESIYSKLLKKKDKDKEETSTSKPKEPIYAKIRPKLKLDTSFKPIEPLSSKSSTEISPVVKPEPIYSKVKPKTPSSPISATSFSTPSSPAVISSSPRSSFSPPSSNEPIYSKVTPRSKTLPQGTVNLTDSSKSTKRQSSTFPRDIPMESPRAKYPIYTQPLPALPVSKDEDRGRNAKPSNDTNYYFSKVTVREKEISPVRTNVITISNPVYIPSPPSSPRALHSTLKTIVTSENASSSVTCSIVTSTPPISPPYQKQKTFGPNVSATSSTHLTNASHDSLCIVPPPKSGKLTGKDSKEKLSVSQRTSSDNILGSGSFTGLDSDTESSGGNLSKLVEELALELEAVSRRLGTDVSTDSHSKKEVLSKLLATYDIPKNLKRVPEVNEEAALKSEQDFARAYDSADELRFVDERVDTYYADIPDYSQDEFVIALDDENDPKYASITREMRQDQQRVAVDMSPGKVSRRSAQVYVNVINVLSALKVLVNSNSSKASGVINKMGTLARPYAKKVKSSVKDSVADSNWIQRRIYHISVRRLKF